MAHESASADGLIATQLAITINGQVLSIRSSKNRIPARIYYHITPRNIICTLSFFFEHTTKTKIREMK
jgi:hypothetical protein